VRYGSSYEIFTSNVSLDLREPSVVPLNFTKSINLALSERGINSMRMANRPLLVESVLKQTIPMHGRMIHGEKDEKLYEQSQTYDIHGRVRSPMAAYKAAMLIVPVYPSRG
jgi:kynurenine 3-monooxygenase